MKLMGLGELLQVRYRKVTANVAKREVFKKETMAKWHCATFVSSMWTQWFEECASCKTGSHNVNCSP